MGRKLDIWDRKWFMEEKSYFGHGERRHKPFFKVNEGRGRCVFVFGVNETRAVLGILKFTTAHQPIYIPL